MYIYIHCLSLISSPNWLFFNWFYFLFFFTLHILYVTWVKYFYHFFYSFWVWKRFWVRKTWCQDFCCFETFCLGVYRLIFRYIHNFWLFFFKGKDPILFFSTLWKVVPASFIKKSFLIVLTMNFVTVILFLRGFNFFLEMFLVLTMLYLPHKSSWKEYPPLLSQRICVIRNTGTQFFLKCFIK